MLGKAKATLILPLKVVLLPVRLSINAFSKVIRKEAETPRADVQLLFKTVPRHPLHSYFVSRSALMVATGLDQSSFKNISPVYLGQAGQFNELQLGSWKPFLTKLFNTKKEGTKKNFSEQNYLKDVNCHSSIIKPLSDYLRDPYVGQMLPSNIGMVLLSCHVATYFISSKSAMVHSQSSNTERSQLLSATVDKSLTLQLGGVASVKNTCNDDIDKFLPNDWHKLLASVVMITRLAHLLLFMAWFKKMYLSVSNTRIPSIANVPIKMLNLRTSRKTHSHRSKRDPGTSSASALPSDTNSNEAFEIGKQVSEVSQTSSNLRIRGQASKDAPKRMEKVASYLADDRASDRGRRRKRGKRGKGKSRSEHSDVPKDTARSSEEINNSRVGLSLRQATQKAGNGLSTCEKENMKATKSSTIRDIQGDYSPSGLLSSSYRKERENTEATSACKNMKTNKVECMSNSHIGNQMFVNQSKRMSQKEKCKELTSPRLQNGSTSVPNMPDFKKTSAIKNHQSSSSSLPAVSEYAHRCKHEFGSFELSETIQEKMVTDKSHLNEEARPEYRSDLDFNNAVFDSSKRSVNLASQALMRVPECNHSSTKNAISDKAGSAANHSSRAECQFPPSMVSQKNKTRKPQAFNHTWTESQTKTCDAAEAQELCRNKECLHLSNQCLPKAECPATDISTEKLISKQTLLTVLDETSILRTTGSHGGNDTAPYAPSNGCDVQESIICKKTTATPTDRLASKGISPDGNAMLNQQNTKGTEEEERDKLLFKRAVGKRKRGRRGGKRNCRNVESNTMGSTKTAEGP